MIQSQEYLERLYAGVLGKMIGVYLGQPFEGWTHERIMAELGEIRAYVHDHFGLPLLTVDDDLSGTFTFLRALPDHGNSPQITPAQIGKTWLNYLIENKTILWWGGHGFSTEHSVFLRLKQGIDAPRSGSIALNGKTVAEQVGSQIFIDGWGMVNPGDAQAAAEMARRAASVSHDGEGIYGAQVMAAMEAQAFVENDINRLLDVGMRVIPQESTIYRLIDGLRQFHVSEKDWRKAFHWVRENYGYDRFPGVCPIVPNHAIIILSLLYAEDDFSRALMIANTCGWDTDCNSANVGCLMGIKNGLEGINRNPAWRSPLCDRLYISSADGGFSINDAANMTYFVANIASGLKNQEISLPKNGARFHFELPGAVQGFRPCEMLKPNSALPCENVKGHSRAGQRSLAMRFSPGSAARWITDTFIPPEILFKPRYELQASPILYAGQVLHAGISADASLDQTVNCRLILEIYGANDLLEEVKGPDVWLNPGEYNNLTWRIPLTGGYPIARVGLEADSQTTQIGCINLDFLSWEGAPELTFTRPPQPNTTWKKAWVEGVDRFITNLQQPFDVIQNYGKGLLIQGTREWKDYRVSTRLHPVLAESFGLAVGVQGMRRYYALVLNRKGKALLIKELDGLLLLAETAFDWNLDGDYEFELAFNGKRLTALIDHKLVFDIADADCPLLSGAVALLIEEGHLAAGEIRIEPLAQQAE